MRHQQDSQASGGRLTRDALAEVVSQNCPVGRALPDLAPGRPARQQEVHRAGNIRVHPPLVALQHFNGHAKGGGRGALQDALLRAPPPRLIVAQRDALDPPDLMQPMWSVMTRFAL